MGIASAGIQDRWSAQVKTLWDLGHGGTIFSPSLGFKVTSSFEILAGMDVLTAADSTNQTGSSQNYFINDYRANDRIYGGCSYVF
jgi:hypothetical protein